MGLPGLLMAISVGTAIVGVLYTIYQQSTRQQEYTYNSQRVPVNLQRYDRPHNIRRTDSCSICLENLSEDTVTLTCSHSFHRKCIVEWIKLRKSSCPICRRNSANMQQVSTEGYDRPRNFTRQEVNNCSICMDDLSERILGLRCSHSFHMTCIARWIQLGNNHCPVCRCNI